ncbi:MAG: ATP-binding cassette domain-containing protein [Betaproteobacteria bacterium]
MQKAAHTPPLRVVAAAADTAVTLPAGTAAAFARCLAAEGIPEPAGLAAVVDSLAAGWGDGAARELALADAGAVLREAGFALAEGTPRHDLRADAADPDAPWGSLWLARASSGWQLWHRTAEMGWHLVAGEEGSPWPDARGYVFRRRQDDPITGWRHGAAAPETESDSPATPDAATRPAYWSWVAGLLRGRAGGILLASLFVNLGMVVLPLFAMIVYDKVVSNGIFETLWALAAGVALWLAIETGIRTLRARQIERLAQVLDERIDRQLFSALLNPTRRAGSQPGLAARFLTRYQELAGARDFFSATYLLAAADLPFVLLIWLAIGLIAWPLLLVVLAWTAFYVGAGSFLKARSLRASRAVARAQVAKQAVLTDALSSLDVLRTSHAGGLLFQKFMALARENALNSAWLRDEAARSTSLALVVNAGAYVCLVVTGAYLVFDQVISMGALVAASMLSSRTLGVVGAALLTLGRWNELQRSLHSLAPFLQEDDAGAAGQEPVRRDPETIQGRIGVHDLSHAYGEQAVLSGVDVRIAAGERVALLGRPGSGKSTLARALAGAIAPTAGEVRVDEVALARHDPSSRARWLAFKPQEASLFAGTVEENILMGIPPAADNRERMAALERGIRLSGLDQDLSRGSLSLSQRVEEYGANLSGGQRQKVALARTLALPARIVILDEPSNGLDPESEKLLVARLGSLQDTTLVVVTHSATLLALTQRVIALDRGRVLADGRTAELVRTA